MRHVIFAVLEVACVAMLSLGVGLVAYSIGGASAGIGAGLVAFALAALFLLWVAQLPAGDG